MAVKGSIVQTHRKHTTVRCLTLAWTSDAATGDVSGIASEGVDGELLAVVFTPGSGGVKPDAAYDVTLLDADGFDVLAGKGANLSDVTATRVVPLVGDGVTTNQRAPLSGTLELRVANANNSKQGRVSLYYR